MQQNTNNSIYFGIIVPIFAIIPNSKSVELRQYPTMHAISIESFPSTPHNEEASNERII